MNENMRFLKVVVRFLSCSCLCFVGLMQEVPVQSESWASDSAVARLLLSELLIFVRCCIDLVAHRGLLSSAGGYAGGYAGC